MKVILLGLLCNVVIFLLFAFSCWDICPANWGEATRAICAFLIGAITLLVFAYFIIELANKK